MIIIISYDMIKINDNIMVVLNLLILQSTFQRLKIFRSASGATVYKR